MAAFLLLHPSFDQKWYEEDLFVASLWNCDRGPLSGLDKLVRKEDILVQHCGPFGPPFCPRSSHKVSPSCFVFLFSPHRLVPVNRT